MSTNDKPGTIKADDVKAAMPAKPSQPAQAAQATATDAAAAGAANVATPAGKPEQNIVADMLGKALYDPAKGKANWMGIGITGGLAVLGALVSGMFGLGTIGTIIGLLAGAVGGVALMGSGVVDGMTGTGPTPQIPTVGKVKAITDPDLVRTKDNYLEKLKKATEAYRAEKYETKDQVIRERHHQELLKNQSDLNDFFETGEAIRKKNGAKLNTVISFSKVPSFETKLKAYAPKTPGGKEFDQMAPHEQVLLAKKMMEDQIAKNENMVIPAVTDMLPYMAFNTELTSPARYLANKMENARAAHGKPEYYAVMEKSVHEMERRPDFLEAEPHFKPELEKMKALVEANKVRNILEGGRDANGGLIGELAKEYKDIIDAEIKLQKEKQKQKTEVDGTPNNNLPMLADRGSEPRLGQ